MTPRALRPAAPAALPFPSLGVLLLGALSLGATACGHPASEAECREIMHTAAKLELKARLDGDQKLIEQELSEIEKSMQASMSNKCVGKRVTEGVMTCVRAAKTADELFSECFR
ncbi:MAG TPA: hypothetical protein VLC09_05015 [Polyangiaceae bacterium]|nr:hypothetical protein [Polyangiaceae bacterium]